MNPTFTNYRLISRDPFAREEIHRHTVYYDHLSCAWCGQFKTTKTGRRFLYRYELETDGGSVFSDQHLFCSISCRRAYNM